MKSILSTDQKRALLTQAADRIREAHPDASREVGERYAQALGQVAEHLDALVDEVLSARRGLSERDLDWEMLARLETGFRLLGGHGTTPSDPEIERIFGRFVAASGSEEKAIGVLQKLAEPLPDFRWMPSPPTLPAPQPTWWGATAEVATNVYLEAQIRGMAQLVSCVSSDEHISIPGLERLVVAERSDDAGAERRGWAGLAGDGERKRFDLTFESSSGDARCASFWIETKGDLNVNGGWIGPVPPELFWFGAMSLVDEGAAGFRFRDRDSL